VLSLALRKLDACTEGICFAAFPGSFATGVETGGGGFHYSSGQDDQERRREKQRGRAVFMVVEKSSKATVHAPSLIRRPLNPGGQTPRQELFILFKKVYNSSY
jgi:hypothetical protein